MITVTFIYPKICCMSNGNIQEPCQCDALYEVYGMLTSLKAFYPIVSYSNVPLSQMVLLRILHKTLASGTCSCTKSALSVSV